MRATNICGPRDIRLEEVDDLVLASGPGEGGEPASGRDVIVAEAYKAMDARRATKVLLRP